MRASKHNFTSPFPCSPRPDGHVELTSGSNEVLVQRTELAMNLALIDPFVLALDVPETLTNRLRSSGVSVCLRFSPQGDYLASGTSKGSIAIFDLETNGVARKLRGHTPGKQVQSFSWSASGRYLLSSSQDWRCILWDMQDGSKVRVVNFGAPVFIGELHPRDHLKCVAALWENQPIIADMNGDSPEFQLLSSEPKKAADDDQNGVADDPKHYAIVAVFTPSGDHIITGTNKGWLHVLETETREMIYSTKLSSKPLVGMRISASGRDLLVNSTDNVIRTLKLPDFADPKLDKDSISLDVEHKFQDVVNRLSWNHVAFSASSDHVMASTGMNHDVYIWERRVGSLVKILEGPKEELGAVEWHPRKPIAAATGAESGRIYLWSVNTPQKWAALAPDFVEVEENIEYVEREDEFDIQPIEELHKRRLDLEDEEVDVLSIDPTKPGSAGDNAFRMPVLLDVSASDSEDDLVAVGAGEYRRKTSHVNAELGDDDKIMSDGRHHGINGDTNGDAPAPPRRDKKRRRV